MNLSGSLLKIGVTFSTLPCEVVPDLVKRLVSGSMVIYPVQPSIYYKAPPPCPSCSRASGDVESSDFDEVAQKRNPSVRNIGTGLRSLPKK